MTGPCVMLCVGLANGAPTPDKGKWLAAFDPEAMDGRGLAAWTSDRKRAYRFHDPETAWRVWHAIPANRTTRPDGKPNRPLTAYSVMVEPA